MQRLTHLWRRLPATLQIRRNFSNFPSAISPVVCQQIPFRFAHSLSQREVQNIPPKPAMRQPTESFGNFDLIKRVKLDFTDVFVSKWRSKVTGLTVIHLDYEGPSTLFPV